MSQPSLAAEDVRTDQSLRSMLDAITRLEAVCAADAKELDRFMDQRARDLREAEKIARSNAQRAIDRAVGLAAPLSLGSELRNGLAELPWLQAKHVGAGPAPETLESAVQEWTSLAKTTRGEVDSFMRSIRTWESTVFKRIKSRPEVADHLWRTLDRLDLIHHSTQPLLRAAVVEQIRQVSGATAIQLQALSEKQVEGQRAQAHEVRTAVADVEARLGLGGAAWDDPRWESPLPPVKVDRLVRLGQFKDRLPANLALPSVPALVAFPFMTGIAISADVSSRLPAVGLVRSLVLRLFAAVPPGGIQIKAIDPVSLGQSVAEFRHLSEYDSRVMDEKTWTSEREIERLLDDLTAHLEIVISKYLRGQFHSIDEYNEHAGEVAQPYRLLAIFDYPSGFSERASQLLLSLVENGPRCGVYTILHYDPETRSHQGHREAPIGRLVHSMQKVKFEGRQVAVDSPGGCKVELVAPGGVEALELVPDSAPAIVFDQEGNPQTGPARLLTRVGEVVRKAESNPPMVTLESLLPLLSRARSGTLPDLPRGAPALSTDPSTWWHASTTASAMAVLGRNGAQSVTSMRFSSTEIAGGAIMVGLPRSGKTTALHAMILTMAMLYSPEELELYLIDAKHGVEFEIYRNLPHARMVSVHSEREFSLAVLKSIQAKIRDRAALFKSHRVGLANITEFRRVTGETIPRIVVIIDEFHELFEEPDSIGFDAFAAFSDIVRMGPFAGVHIIVSSQTLSAMPAMDRQTLLLLPERATFQCNEDDAEILMGASNRAPRALVKQGQGVFNPARGEESQNQLFQGLFVPSAPRAELLDDLLRKAGTTGWTRRPRVFDGQAIVARPSVQQLLKSRPSRFTIPVGEPFTLADTESLVLPRARGSNILLVGDRDEDPTSHELRGVLHSILVAAPLQAVGVTVVDLVGDEQVRGGSSVMDVASMAGARYLRSRSFPIVVKEFAELVATRNAADAFKDRAEVLVLFGLQRAVSLSPLDPYDDADEEEPSLAKLLASVVIGGPEVGVHVVVSADRAYAAQMRLGTEILGDFALRIAGSASDDRDLRMVAGDYGDIRPLPPGQLLITDSSLGSSKRVRGYGLVNSMSDEPQEG